MEDRGRGDETVGMEDRGRGRVEDSVGWRGDVSARHQDVGGLGQVGHRRRAGQALRVVRLVVIIGKVVQHVARVVWGGQALGVGVLSCQIVGHLGFVGGRQVIRRGGGHIGLRAKTKHCVQTATILWSWRMVSRFWSMVCWFWGMVSRFWSMVCWFWSMVSRFWSMVCWFWSMVCWSWMISRMKTKYFLQ